MIVIMVALALIFAFLLCLTTLFDCSRPMINMLFLCGIFLPVIALMIIAPLGTFSGVAGGWERISGIEIGIDGYSRLFLAAELVVFSLVGVYAVSYYGENPRRNKFFSLILVMHAALMGVFTTRDIFNLFVLMELASVSAFVLVAFSGGKGSEKAAFRYLLFSLTASYLFLLSIGMIYSQTGHLNLELIGENIGRSREIDIAVGIAFVAMILKAGIFPLHFWLPDVYSESDTPVCALLAGMTRRAPVYAMLMFCIYLPMNHLSEMLMYVGFASLFFGTIMALFQNDVWRMLAYTSIGLMGIILVGIATENTMAVAYYAFAHAVVTTGLFLTTGTLSDLQATRNVRDLTYQKDVFMFTSIVMLSVALGSLSPTLNAFAKSQLITGLSGMHLILFQGGFVMALLVMLKMNYLLWQDDGTRPYYKKTNIRSVVSAIPAILLVSLGLYFYPVLVPADILVLMVAGTIFLLIISLNVLEYQGIERIGCRFRELGNTNNYYSIAFFAFLVLVLFYAF